MWATKFLGLGYKVARADEAESQLAKNMREKKTAKAPAKKGELFYIPPPLAEDPGHASTWDTCFALVLPG